MPSSCVMDDSSLRSVSRARSTTARRLRRLSQPDRRDFLQWSTALLRRMSWLTVQRWRPCVEVGEGELARAVFVEWRRLLRAEMDASFTPPGASG